MLRGNENKLKTVGETKSENCKLKVICSAYPRHIRNFNYTTFRGPWSICSLNQRESLPWLFIFCEGAKHKCGKLLVKAMSDLMV